jgi:solute carrier family 25 iron transporter 28/37
VGASSNLFHDCILTPTEAIKQRMQLLSAENANTTLKKVVSTMYKTEGIKSFYRSFGINYFMNVPFGALLVTLNETLKEKYLSTQE